MASAIVGSVEPLRFPSRASQIRSLAIRGFSIAEIAKHCNCDKSDVHAALFQAKHPRPTSYGLKMKTLEKRLNAIDEVLFEIRRQVRKLNGEPDDPCERRLAGLPL